MRWWRRPGDARAPAGGRPTGSTGGSPTAPPALSEAEAATRYLEIVRPYNEALEQFELAVNGGEELATLTGMASDTADALETEIGELRATAWPEAISTHVDALIGESEQALEHWQEAARAQTRDDLVDSVLAAAEFDGSDPTGSIREILNLDAYDEDDY